MQSIRLRERDCKTLRVTLRVDGEKFVVPDGWAVIFTAKRFYEDLDEDAVIQKFSGHGITIENDVAVIEFVAQDTYGLGDVALVCDVWVVDSVVGTRRSAARFLLSFDLAVTQEVTPSVPIYTSHPPIPYGNFTIYSATPPEDTTRDWVDTTTGIRSYWYEDAWIAMLTTVVSPIPALAYMSPTGEAYTSPTGDYYTAPAA